MADIKNIPINEHLRVSNPKINQNFQNLNTETVANANNLENHKNSTAAHAAQNITYFGKAVGDNVKSAIDYTNDRISEIVAQAGNDNTEIVDARGAYAVLGDRLNASDKRLVEIAINIMSFGAKGDGVTDDISAINNSILAAESLGGGTVLVPSGRTFIIGNQINMKSNIRFIIDGIIRVKDKAVCHAMLIDGCSNVIIEGKGKIDGNRANQTPPNPIAGIYTVNKANHITIRDIHVTECFNWPINVVDSYNVLIDNVVGSNSQNSFEFARGCYNCWARNIEVYGLGDFGFAFYGGIKDSGIINSQIHHNNIDGIIVLADGGQESTCENISIIGNAVYHNGYSGIALRSDLTTPDPVHDNIVISGNLIHDNNQHNVGGLGGIWIQAGKYITISDNIISHDGNGESSTVGINIKPQEKTVSNLIIKGNTIKNEGQGGGLGVSIQLYQTDNVLIEGNIFEDDQEIKTTAFHINGDGGKNNLIKNNIIGSSAGPKLRFTPGPGNEVVGNIGWNPLGQLTAPPVPASLTNVVNTTGYIVRVFVSGGVVQNIAVNNANTGLANGMFVLAPGDQILLQYTTAPSWLWFAM
ncbi:hypothetical protein J25TS5_03950 [Paenibacillus faecis]|uniref:right-handed parallel beta-helix repeat-containing protein n=1 Tax=Paenibacillus faecis TaxID=862114 RepID=UPI001B07BE56|nr:right-handed parallel beta-helix repeat-containing protein [Paenibacillus faecis]GIO83463.1 hypothetical protein J25TS5_03950 [Paenibacillus faecis]